MGIYAIGLGIVGLTTGVLEKNFSKDSKISCIIMVSILTFLFETIFYMLNMFFIGIQNIQIIEFLKILLIEILYNDILMILLYSIFTKFGNKLEEDFINKSFF